MIVQRYAMRTTALAALVILLAQIAARAECGCVDCADDRERGSCSTPSEPVRSCCHPEPEAPAPECGCIHGDVDFDLTDAPITVPEWSMLSDTSDHLVMAPVEAPAPVVEALARGDPPYLRQLNLRN